MNSLTLEEGIVIVGISIGASLLCIGLFTIYFLLDWEARIIAESNRYIWERLTRWIEIEKTEIKKMLNGKLNKKICDEISSHVVAAKHDLKGLLKIKGGIDDKN
jgi:hypothetical protein